MKVGKLNEEIEKIDMVKYHRIFVPKKKDAEEVTDDTLVETADIYIKDDIPLGQAIGELEKTCILNHCYAAIINADEQMVFVTNIKGRRIVRYKGESFDSLETLVDKTDSPIHWTAVKEINLSFNLGSYNLIFG